MASNPYLADNLNRLGWRHCLKSARSPEDIRFLLKHGANANSPEGAECLHRAASDKRSRSIEALLKAGAQTSHVTSQGDALLVAINRGCRKCVRLLLPVSNLSVVNQDGRNAHEEAAAFSTLAEPLRAEILSLVELEIGSRQAAAEAAQIQSAMSAPSKPSPKAPRV